MTHRSPALLLLALTAAAPAQASLELARTRICLGCHAVDQTLVGPSFKAIAARYAGQRDAAPRLAEKIMRGSKGGWGAVPMPANPAVSADEARRLAEWVLGLR
jgi:cytochrome c